MKVSLWQRRIHRAQELSRQHPFASEILGFYIHLARFQEDLYQRLSGAPPQKEHAASISAELRPDELQNLSSRFEAFLSVAESQGPKPLADLSRQLQNRGSRFWSELLHRGGGGNAPPDTRACLS